MACSAANDAKYENRCTVVLSYREWKADFATGAVCVALKLSQDLRNWCKVPAGLLAYLFE